MKSVCPFLSLWMIVMLITAGCMQPKSRQVSDEGAAARSRIANPAVEKCLEDGYVAEPVMENGVPVDHRCVDPETGRSCGVWEYFRNTCTLPDND